MLTSRKSLNKRLEREHDGKLSCSLERRIHWLIGVTTGRNTGVNTDQPVYTQLERFYGMSPVDVGRPWTNTVPLCVRWSRRRWWSRLVVVAVFPRPTCVSLSSSLAAGTWPVCVKCTASRPVVASPPTPSADQQSVVPRTWTCRRHRPRPVDVFRPTRPVAGETAPGAVSQSIDRSINQSINQSVSQSFY